MEKIKNLTREEPFCEPYHEMLDAGLLTVNIPNMT